MLPRTILFPLALVIVLGIATPAAFASEITPLVPPSALIETVSTASAQSKPEKDEFPPSSFIVMLGMPFWGKDVNTSGAQMTLEADTFLTEKIFAHLVLGFGGYSSSYDVNDNNDETLMKLDYDFTYFKIGAGAGYHFDLSRRAYLRTGATIGYRFYDYTGEESAEYSSLYNTYTYGGGEISLSDSGRTPFVEPYVTLGFKLMDSIYWGITISYILSPKADVIVPVFSYTSDLQTGEDSLPSSYFFGGISLIANM